MLSERIFFLIESIGDLSNLETEVGYGIQKLVQELKRILPYVRAIDYREDQQFEEGPYLEISSIVDNAEDLIGDLTIDENLSNPLEAEVINEGASINWTRIIGNLALNCCNIITGNVSHTTNPTDCKITALIQRIEGFYMAISSVRTPIYNFNTGNNYNFGLEQKTGDINVHIGHGPPTLNKPIAGRQSYGHIQNHVVVGFLGETETLLHQLIRNDQTRVVGVVGMGGSGKTTLAKHLYRHADIKNHFAHKVWICVSQSWSKRDLLYEIFRQTQGAQRGQDMVKSWSDEEFAENLYQFLSAQLYLVVLDDVWAVDAWNSISPALPPSEGSKFLVTTRNEAIPKLVDLPFFVLEPKPLNPEESFELFYKRAFTDGVPSSECMDLGKNMVQKCKGLPLAITALAGALRGKKSLSDWRRVSKTLTQRIMKTEDSTTKAMVDGVLALSYHDLPDYVKPCFLYLSIFPEDHVIKARMLMRMWIAECLITCDPLSEEETMLRAEEFLDELIQRYIVQDVSRNYMGRVKAFQIHDLIREMCCKNAKERGFIKESHRVSLCFSISLLQAEQQWRDRLNSFNHPGNSARLRALTFFLPKGSLIGVEERLVLNLWSVFSKFKFLRVLMLLLASNNYKLPEAIGNLIHLRYLGLWGGDVRLPESIENLQNLQTLDLQSFPVGLSNNLWKLKCLRRLYFLHYPTRHEPGDWKLLRLDTLENLQIIWNIGGGDWMLSEMARLCPTLQKLSIVDIRCQEHLDAVFNCPRVLDNLQVLKLAWYFNVKPLNMEALKQYKKLCKLILVGNIPQLTGKTLAFPPNLVRLDIFNAGLEATDLMTILGDLPRLKFLRLGKDAYSGTKLTCKAGSFPVLEQLEFSFLNDLNSWTVEKGAMPCLKHLLFMRCRKLHQFPRGWRFVSKLQEVTTSRMSSQFNESLLLARKYHADLEVKINGSTPAKSKWIIDLFKVRAIEPRW